MLLFEHRKRRKREANSNPLPRVEDLTDPPQGGRFSHQPQPHSSFVGSLNEVQKDDAAYEKLSRPSELSPVYYNLASPDNNYQRLQTTNWCSLVSRGGPSNNLTRFCLNGCSFGNAIRARLRILTNWDLQYNISRCYREKVIPHGFIVWLGKYLLN